MDLFCDVNMIKLKDLYSNIGRVNDTGAYMKKILCSSGALLGKNTNYDYTRMKEFSEKLNCDGFEFMVYSRWYDEFDELLKTLKAAKLNIPVIHAQKSLGESLCGMTTTYENEQFHDYIMTKEEDEATFAEGTKNFALNIRAAEELGASKMVLHLWNGTVSDKNLDRNIERYGVWKDMAQKAGINLMVENVICNTHDPLSNVSRVAKAYEDAGFVYDTKMAEFHCQTMKLFDPDYEWIAKGGKIHHLHVNDYSGGYMDWSNMKVLPIGEGHVDFDAFFAKLSEYGYDGDFTVEATAMRPGNIVDFDMLNTCFNNLRTLRDKYL